MKRSTVFLILGVVLLLAAGFCGLRVWQSVYAPAEVLTETPPTLSPAPTETPPPSPAPTPEATPEPTAEPTPTPSPSPTPYVSPIDFDALRDVNWDIYAWLEIDDTNISYPVVQGRDDTFYLDHNSDGVYSANGSIFSESAYNSTDLTDPVTILYGHHMRSGSMFGELQAYYTDSEFFDSHEIIRLYTPDTMREYGVFAAVPFSGEHILYYNDFTDEEAYSTFFFTVMSIRDLNAHFRDEYVPEPGDQVLILSTCLAGNNTRRFLVMATLLD